MDIQIWVWELILCVIKRYQNRCLEKSMGIEREMKQDTEWNQTNW